MNQNFQFQEKKKTVTCCSVLSYLSTCSLVDPLSTKPKERSKRFGVGVYFLSSLKSLSWILTFHNFIYRHIKCIGQKFVCMVATRGQHILLPRRCGLQNRSKRKWELGQRRCAFIEYINPYYLPTDCHKASYQKTTNQTWKTCCYTHPSLFFSSLQ